MVSEEPKNKNSSYSQIKKTASIYFLNSLILHKTSLVISKSIIQLIKQKQ